MERTAVTTTELEPRPQSVRQARRLFIAAAADGGLSSEAVERGALAVSELVTNAIVHGVGPIAIRTVVQPTIVRFEVSDGGDSLPQARGEPTTATGGRGLAIVTKVTGDWGYERRRVEPGKTVWFTLPRSGAA